MSAICGILRFDGAPAGARNAERMLAVMKHRAPDRRRVSCNGPVALGHGLLRITQEDLFDSQPLTQGGVLLVADLRLDNREALAEMLGIDKARLMQMSDSALLMAAWLRWGDDCVTRLLGDFAFAIWDGAAGRLLLARDPMGQRNLFWHRGRDFFAFSTEIKGLWALGEVPRTHSGHPMRALADGPAASVGRDPTDSLNGGAWMAVTQDGGDSAGCFWSPAPDPDHQGREDEYYVSAYRRVLEEAVACRVRRNLRPAGLLFSGGFDSAAIAALAASPLRELGHKLVAAASVMPEDYCGTIRHARRWTELCRRDMPHLDLHYITPQGRDVLNGLEEAFLRTGSGQAPGHYIETALLQSLAAGGARVAMDGNGGDYTLNVRGFPWLLDLFRKGHWRQLAAEMRAVHRHSGASYWKIAKAHLFAHLLPWSLRDMRNRRCHGLALWGPTMPITRDFLAERRNPSFTSAPPPGNAVQMRALLRQVLMSQQKSRFGTATAAAAQGMDFTRPFHDRRVVELALAIPERLWVRNGRERYLARMALKDLYPPEFQNRGRGNDGPTPDFLRMIRNLEPRLLAEIARMEQGGKLGRYFDFPKMRRMLTRRRMEDHNSGAEYDTHQAVAAFLQARYMEWLRREN